MEKKEVIVGRNPVNEYLKAMEPNAKGVELHIASNSHGKIIDAIRRIAKTKGIHLFLENKDFFKKYSSASKSQGVVLLVPLQKKKRDLTETLEAIADKNGVVVLLDQITDPHNMGSIIRTAEVFGCDAVVIPKNNSAVVNETVRKTSAGATAYIDTFTVPNLSRFIADAKELGFWIIGSSDHGSTTMDKLKDIKPVCIIIGSEGTGMRRLTEEKCDYIISIPLKGKVSSLNASVAAGIILYETTK